MHAVLRSRLAIVAFAAAVTAVAVVGGVAHGAGPATPGNGRGPQAYTIGLFGDMPYNALGRSQYPNLLADVNANDVAFSVFDGDLKAGGDGACTNDLYATAIRNFNTLKRPLVWLHADAYERQQFASTDQSLGQQTLTLTRQQRDYPENVRWSYGPVVYMGLNVQGSNDNYPYAGVDGETRPDAEIARQRAEEVAPRPPTSAGCTTASPSPSRRARRA
jgi:hypothetical protein